MAKKSSKKKGTAPSLVDLHSAVVEAHDNLTTAVTNVIEAIEKAKKDDIVALVEELELDVDTDQKIADLREEFSEAYSEYIASLFGDDDEDDDDDDDEYDYDEEDEDEDDEDEDDESDDDDDDDDEDEEDDDEDVDDEDDEDEDEDDEDDEDDDEDDEDDDEDDEDDDDEDDDEDEDDDDEEEFDEDSIREELESKKLKELETLAEEAELDILESKKYKGSSKKKKAMLIDALIEAMRAEFEEDDDDDDEDDDDEDENADLESLSDDELRQVAVDVNAKHKGKRITKSSAKKLTRKQLIAAIQAVADED